MTVKMLFNLLDICHFTTFLLTSRFLPLFPSPITSLLQVPLRPFPGPLKVAIHFLNWFAVRPCISLPCSVTLFFLHTPHSPTLMTKTAGSFEMSVYIYQITWHHTAQDSNLQTALVFTHFLVATKKDKVQVHCSQIMLWVLGGGGTNSNALPAIYMFGSSPISPQRLYFLLSAQ